MILAAHQPQYLPYLGYFHKMAAADVFVHLDDVQYKHREFQNRNRIRTPGGWIWLTVPVKVKGRREQSIAEVEIDNDKSWAEEHWESLKRNYARAPHFTEHAPAFERFYARRWTRLADLCLELAGYLASALGVRTPARLASSFGVSTFSTRRLVDLCRAAGADTYLSGAGGRDYLDEGLFREAGLELRYQDFRPPAYPQCFPGFEPNLAAVDALFNAGPGASAWVGRGEGR